MYVNGCIYVTSKRGGIVGGGGTIKQFLLIRFFAVSWYWKLMSCVLPRK